MFLCSLYEKVIGPNSAKKVYSQSIWYFDLSRGICYWILTSDTDHSHDFNFAVRNTDYEISGTEVEVPVPRYQGRNSYQPVRQARCSMYPAEWGNMSHLHEILWVERCTSGHIWVSEVKTLCAIHVFRSPGSFARAPLLPGSWNMAVMNSRHLRKKWKYYDSHCLFCLSYLNFSLFMLIKKSLKIHLHSMHPQVFKIDREKLSNSCYT